MYTDTIFGIKWRNALAPNELIYIIVIIALAVLFYFLYKYNLKLKNRILQARLLFQFKIKQFDLTNLQIRILNHIIELQKLKDPKSIFNNPGMFEASIGDMLEYLKDSTEDGESLIDICKDLIITYEKLYHHTLVQKPIESISGIEEGRLLYFYIDPLVVYIGKVIEKKAAALTLKLFRNPRDLPPVVTGSIYNFFLWRSGDAEYIFITEILSYNEGRIDIKMPDEFTRGKEVRHPYIDVLIPCTLLISDPSYHGNGDQAESISATILKMNEHEAVMRQAQKLDYRYTYALFFKIDDFKVNAIVKVIADKTITEGNIHYHTCKFTEISDAAKTVLHKFLIDHF